MPLSENGYWADRDFELNLRNKLAQLIAEITSGSEGAIPEQADFDLADKTRKQIEENLRA